MTLHKPVEVNLAGEGSEISEDEALVRNIYLNITNEKEKKKSKPVQASTRKVDKSPNRLPGGGFKSPSLRAAKSPLSSKY